MINITDKTKCCGCTACMNVCPKKAITMQPDEEGFLYPVTDVDVCIDCGLCDMVCPVEQKPFIRKEKRKSYVLRTKKNSVLLDSTSGGFITPLAIWILENRGVFCAAAYNESFEVEHIILDSLSKKDALSSIRGSKYVQSNLKNCFCVLKQYLEQDRLVCFVGTPCQVNGIKGFLQRNYNNLVTIDVVCHGVSSHKVWNNYLNYQKEKYHSEIKKVKFRNKTYGYHSGTMMIQFVNGKIYYGSGRVDYMLKSFFSDIVSRPICYKCPFKSIERNSDFTIYDCWHASELVEGLKDDDKGYTNVIVQSDKGLKIMEQIKSRYELYQVDTMAAIELDGDMAIASVSTNPNRENFFDKIDNVNLHKLANEYFRVSVKDRILENTKKVLYQLRILYYLKRLIIHI